MTTTAAKIARYDVLEAKDGLHCGVQGASVPSAAGHHHLEQVAMEAIELDGRPATDTGWADLHRGELTNLANGMLCGVHTARIDDPNPAWVDQAIASHEALLTGLGRSLGDGSTLIRRVTPTVVEGWNMVATVHADEHSAVLVSGSYGPNGSIETRHPVRWGQRTRRR